MDTIRRNSHKYSQWSNRDVNKDQAFKAKTKAKDLVFKAKDLAI